MSNDMVVTARYDGKKTEQQQASLSDTPIRLREALDRGATSVTVRPIEHLTDAQADRLRVDLILTPDILAQIRASTGQKSTGEWSEGLGVSVRTINRIRSGERRTTRKPMGGDRRSDNWRGK